MIKQYISLFFRLRSLTYAKILKIIIGNQLGCQFSGMRINSDAANEYKGLLFVPLHLDYIYYTVTVFHATM